MYIGWTDGTSKGTLSTPLGKGGRLILLHAGGYEGFVENGMLIFQSKKTGDYHEEMDSERFEKWFSEQLLPKLPTNSIIVMDNAPYHSRQLNRAPTSATKKADILAWLDKHSIPYPQSNNLFLFATLYQY